MRRYQKLSRFLVFWADQFKIYLNSNSINSLKEKKPLRLNFITFEHRGMSLTSKFLLKVENNITCVKNLCVERFGKTKTLIFDACS